MTINIICNPNQANTVQHIHQTHTPYISAFPPRYAHRHRREIFIPLGARVPRWGWFSLVRFPKFGIGSILADMRHVSMNPHHRIGDRQDKKPQRGFREDQSPPYTEHDFSILFNYSTDKALGLQDWVAKEPKPSQDALWETRPRNTRAVIHCSCRTLYSVQSTRWWEFDEISIDIGIAWP